VNFVYITLISKQWRVLIPGVSKGVNFPLVIEVHPREPILSLGVNFSLRGKFMASGPGHLFFRKVGTKTSTNQPHEAWSLSCDVGYYASFVKKGLEWLRCTKTFNY
jgi:hypothetical protein